MKEINKTHLHSLRQLIEDGARDFGNNPLFRFERGGVDYTVHYGEFEAYVTSIARGLIAPPKPDAITLCLQAEHQRSHQAVLR